MAAPRSDPALVRRLRALASFLPAFEAPAFQFGQWEGGEQIEPGRYTMPYYSFSPVVEEFLQRAVAGWVQPFDWPAWTATEEFEQLRTDPTVLAKASPEQLSHLLTALVRAERFGDGNLAAAFDSGLLVRIMHRAGVLADELDARPEPAPDVLGRWPPRSESS